jgi:hypothetical protein
VSRPWCESMLELNRPVPGNHVLDLATGTGVNALLLAESVGGGGGGGGGSNSGRAPHVVVTLLAPPPPRLIGWNACRPMRRLNGVRVGHCEGCIPRLGCIATQRGRRGE